MEKYKDLEQLRKLCKRRKNIGGFPLHDYKIYQEASVIRQCDIGIKTGVWITGTELKVWKQNFTFMIH